MNNKFTEMVQSIVKYGGYYVGRYETSLYTTEGQNSTNGTVVKTVTDQTPMASVDWYKMYLTQDSNYQDNPYYGSDSVTSTMIWGTQYDTMLNFILEGSDKEKVKKRTGNHTGTRSTTGQFGNDIMNNIFDLSSNIREWTQEANSTSLRIGRGGYYYIEDTYTASERDSNYPTYNYNFYGSRLSLYLK